MLHQGTGFPHAQNGDLLDDCEKVKENRESILPPLLAIFQLFRWNPSIHLMIYGP